MIRLREFPNRSFKNANEAFAALKEHEDRLINLKCAQVYKSVDKLQGFSVSPFFQEKMFSAKAMDTPSWLKDGNIYPIINTTKYFDSHGDVHFDGIWNRSVKANKGKLYYVESHSLKVADIIAWPEDVKAFTANIPWSMVGKAYEGETQALIYEIPDERIDHVGARKVIDGKKDIQNSVRMQYVKMKLAINSDSKEWKENKELYDERIDLVANKEIVDEFGYFWAVDEAKIFKEGSMVIAGSNDATTNIYGNEEPAKGTSDDPPQGTQLTAKQIEENAYFNNLI